MKLFVSHACENSDIVNDLVDLLQLGAGIAHNDIFCSSIKGKIPNGAYFVQYILSNLNAADLIVAVLSRAYFRSEFCIAEAGAAQARSLANTASFFSLIVPPVGFSNLDGVLYGVQSSAIQDAKELDGLRDRATKGMASPPSTATWNDKRDAFLAEVADKVDRQYATELLQLITVQDFYIDRSADPAIKYKSKIWIVFRNDTGETLEAAAPTWLAKTGDVPAQSPPGSAVQVEGPAGWERKSWQPEQPNVVVQAGRAFRVWIGLDQAFNDEDLRRRHETKRLGVLALPIRIHNKDVTLQLRP